MEKTISENNLRATPFTEVAESGKGQDLHPFALGAGAPACGKWQYQNASSQDEAGEDACDRHEKSKSQRGAPYRQGIEKYLDRCRHGFTSCNGLALLGLLTCRHVQ